MKKTIYALALTLFLAPSWAHAERMSKTELNLALATQVVSLNSTRSLVLDPESTFMQNETLRQVLPYLDYEQIDADAALLMSARFTQEEMLAIITFYTSDIGISIQQKMKPFRKLLGGLVEEAFQKKFKEMVAAGQITPPTQGNLQGQSMPGLPGMK